jgi:antitoxin YefM
MTRFSEDVQGLTELKAHGSAVVDRVVRSRRPLLITRRGKGVAVLVELSEFERMQDLLGFIEAVEAGAEQSESGQLGSHKEAVKILERFGQETARRSKRK